MPRTTLAGAGRVIDQHVAMLDAALRGPRRSKADLLAEARDGLVDAADSYADQGLPRDAAERRAVEGFGSVRDVAPAYQAELDLSQGRRTALSMLVVLALQPLLWGPVQQGLGGAHGDAGVWFARVDAVVGWLGAIAIIGAVLAALACGVGVRRLTGTRPVVRGIGGLTLVACAAFASVGVVLSALRGVDGWMDVLPLAAYLLLPLSGVASSARRCLHAA